ncbi:MAG: hypothetical protein M0Q93_00855 [Terrimicrobiaceae bacterium]|jgi:hypothetical protein|nr:hypothetical protein [Terrimicrobiaceae bacterium]
MPSILDSRTVDVAANFISPQAPQQRRPLYSSVPFRQSKDPAQCIPCAEIALDQQALDKFLLAGGGGGSNPFAWVSPTAKNPNDLGYVSIAIPEIPPSVDPGPDSRPRPYPEEIWPTDGSTIIIHRGLIAHFALPALLSCQESAGLIFVNTSIVPATVIVDGTQPGFGVDDDVVFDSVTYEDNEHIYWGGGSPCWGMLHRNGAHAFYFTKEIRPLGSLVIQARDNGYGGFGTSLRCDISFP